MSTSAGTRAGSRRLAGAAVLAAVAAVCGGGTAQPPKKKGAPPAAAEQKQLYAEWVRLFETAGKQNAAGEPEKAAETYDKALGVARRLFPRDRYPDGRPELADNYRALAHVYIKMNRYADAERNARAGLAEVRRIHREKDHTGVAEAHSQLGYVLQFQGKYAAAERAFRDALAVYRRLRGDADDPDVARELLNVAFTLRHQGKLADAEQLLRRSLDMHLRLFPGKDHRGVAFALSHTGGILRARGRPADAEPYFRDALAMQRRLHAGRDHPEVAQELNNLAVVLMSRGRYAEAEPLFREALGIYDRLLGGRPHPTAAAFRNNLGRLLLAEGKPAAAEREFRDALAVYRRLFPRQDHPDVALTLAHLGDVASRLGRHDAVALYGEALAMRERLARDGSRDDVLMNLIALGNHLVSLGRYADGEPHLKDAMALARRLYPGEDHPSVGLALSSLANLHTSRREFAAADPFLREALAISRRQIEASARTRPEGDTLALLAEAPLLRDAFLANALALGLDPADAYREVWLHKSAALRVYEGRQLGARAAAAGGAAKTLAGLVDARRRRAELLLAPAPPDPETRKARDDELAALDDRIAGLDRDLRLAVPAVGRTEKLARSTPADLQAVLPPGTAVVDFVQYRRYAQDPDRPGQAGRTQTPHYLAFVLTRDRVAWADLGPAAETEKAVAAWRAAIESGKEIPDAIPARVRERVWAGVAKLLPPAAAVYVVPDLALCRVPWPAVPGSRPGSVLLEDHAVAVLPHAGYLLDRLWPQDPAPARPADAVVVGGVDYGAAPAGAAAKWAALPWAAAEAGGVAAAAGRAKIPVRTVGGEKATTAAVLAELPNARFAHLATHGFFADEPARAELNLDPGLFAVSPFGERVGRAVLNPLVMTGLVFAGANRPDAPARGTLTGEGVVDLDLSGLELAVLSACESGLGDVAGGEGTFGLQRAFHLAGTRDVVASLWKVPDQATAALMGVFYRGLWADGLPPMEALRQAQLAVYRNPGKVAELAAGFRGPLKVVPRAPADPPPPAAAGGKAHPLAWAAFVLSGPGR